MNEKLIQIFDITGKIAKDGATGPRSKMFYSDLIFGIEKVDHNGYFGWEAIRYNNLFSQDIANTYEVDINNYNYSEDQLQKFYKSHNYIYNKYTKSIFMEICDRIGETPEKLYQAEIGRRLNFPEFKKHNNRIIAEFIERGRKSGLFKIEKLKKYKYVYIKDINCIPESVYDLRRNNKSKNEAYIANLLEKIPELSFKWGVKLNEWKNAPYDFGVFDNNNLIGLIEVDGEQHYRRIDFFHKTEKDFKRRLEIDKKKEELAEDQNLLFLRISENELKKKNSKNVIKKIKDKFCL